MSFSYSNLSSCLYLFLSDMEDCQWLTIRFLLRVEEAILIKRGKIFLLSIIQVTFMPSCGQV
jgi:hypothetical protein